MVGSQKIIQIRIRNWGTFTILTQNNLVLALILAGTSPVLGIGLRDCCGDPDADKLVMDLDHVFTMIEMCYKWGSNHFWLKPFTVSRRTALLYICMYCIPLQYVLCIYGYLVRVQYNIVQTAYSVHRIMQFQTAVKATIHMAYKILVLGKKMYTCK